MKNKTANKNEAGNLLPISVTQGLTVMVLPSTKYEYLMTTKQVALGYGVSEYAIRQTKLRNQSELIENKHFFSGVTICHAASPGSSKGVMWTKAGIIRLGFFIRSEQAKLFRDWAENLILTVTKPVKQLPAKRKHNRITPERLIKLLAIAGRITDHQLRNEIINELTGGL